MAKKNQNTTAAATETAVQTKAESIRAIVASKPGLKNSEYVELLAKQGVKVTPQQVAATIKPKSVKVDPATIKAAAGFVRAFDGMVDEAEAMIEQVGKFIDSCGSSAKALAALTTYRELQSALKGEVAA